MCVKAVIAAIVAVSLASLPLAAAELSADAINSASFLGKLPREAQLSPLAVKAQVLLDRVQFSPGEIDGQFGDNVRKALRAFSEANGLSSSETLTPEIWAKLQGETADAVIVNYVLSEADVKGPFLEKLPAKMDNMKDLPALNYTSVKEAIAERFHMSPALLAALNSGKKFVAGETIAVVALRERDKPLKIARLEVDKVRETVKAFGSDGALLAFFPASVGSPEKPTPSGTLKVTAVKPNPTYRYDPKYQFRGVKAKEPFTIKPGPNNPVGSIWIGLSEKSFGIHGTAEPSRVSKSESHGCVRMTNWDAERLGKSLKKGVPVSFVDGQKSAAKK